MFEKAITIFKVFLSNFGMISTKSARSSQTSPNLTIGGLSPIHASIFTFSYITAWITQLANIYIDMHLFENNNYLISAKRQLNFMLQKVHFFEFVRYRIIKNLRLD